MKFIIGTKINIKRPIVQVGRSSSQLTQTRSSYQLPYGSYELIRIYKKDGQFCYKWKIENTSEYVEQMFPSTQEADIFIESNKV